MSRRRTCLAILVFVLALVSRFTEAATIHVIDSSISMYADAQSLGPPLDSAGQVIVPGDSVAFGAAIGLPFIARRRTSASAY